MSPTPDSTLDDLQQTIADLKRQLAESNAERDEALAREAASAEVLQVINSSPGDLAPAFDAMLERAMRLCGFDHGSLQTYDGQLFRAVAVRGLPEQLAGVALYLGEGGSGRRSSGRETTLQPSGHHR